MVCIAAFIILCLISLFIGIIAIFKREVGRRYWKTFKKAWSCVWKKVRLQKCETNFKDDIKNSILKKVIIKKPKLVKPISTAIEITAVLIVLITVWSLIEGAKAGLSLYSLGTCNVTTPSACTLGSETCSIDQAQPKNPIEAVGRWFADWGEIFSRLPDKFRSWEVSQFSELSGFTAPSSTPTTYPLTDPTYTAIDIFDPGCVVCLQSFKNQLSGDFFEKNIVKIVPYPIQNPDGTYKFQNAELISRYLLALSDPSYGLDIIAFKIIEKIFTQFDENHQIYQTVLSERLSAPEVEALLQTWITEISTKENIPLNQPLPTIKDLAHSQKITDQLTKNKEIVENQIHANGIPTMINNGKKHTGLYK